MDAAYSIAIETSCRAGGVALGRGEELLGAVPFDAAGRHATQLLQHLDGLLRAHDARPADLAEVYVSSGPGSFTGLRIGITVARTLAQAQPGLRIVAVPTASAVAENARDLDWEHLAVVMDHKDGEFWAAVFTRDGKRGQSPFSAAGDSPPETGTVPRAVCGGLYPVPGKTGTVPREDAGYSPRFPAPGFPALVTAEGFLGRAPRPLLVMGEALAFVKLEAPGVARADPALDLPTPEGVWRVGRRMAQAGEFADPARLLPLYTRKPEAVRLWEKRHPAAK